MKLHRLPVLAVVLGAAGCELFAFADRDLIVTGHGGEGGTTSSAGGGAASGGGGAAAIECVLPIDCVAGDDDCVMVTCTAGRCGEAFVAEGTPTSHQSAGDCVRSVCDGHGDVSIVVDDQDVPVDGDPCTDDVCTAGAPSHPMSSSSTPCDTGGGHYCNGAGQCVECVTEVHCPEGFACVNNRCTSCLDGKMDGTETDVDCGGPSCTACADAEACAVASDCQSGVCEGQPPSCQAPACDDQVKNGDESDVDCGKTCPSGCGFGEDCLVNADCLGGVCEGGACAPSCVDDVKNGGETDVDCGGACPPCAPGKTCSSDVDCQSGACAAAVCAAPTCHDGLMNGDETGKDCGGLCKGCPDGGACANDGDCASRVCLAGACAAPTCSDDAKNGGETGKDCGGPACSPCAVGQPCNADQDCVTQLCTFAICVEPTCSDGSKNGSETDIDCGGSTCPPCAVGGGCLEDSDCASATCTKSVCH